MNLLFLQPWFTDPIVKAIGWTLIHSLWQGLLLTFIAGIIVMFTRRSAPALRYKLLSLLLVAFIAGTVVTFTQELQTGTQDSEVIAKKITDNSETTFSVSVPNEPVRQITENKSSTFPLFQLDGFIDYFNTHAFMIVAIWFMIFLFKCIRLTAHISYAYRLRHYKTFPLPNLQKKLDQLAVLMKVKTSIVVLQSAIVKAPSVIGALKPIILLPIGLLSNLPAEQVEAILLHELAHIRRKDYLVNLLQCIAETIFFFNPSVLWLSSLIRQERENCCDDMAISVIGKKTTYINALVAFQEYRADSRYAPAFPGEKYPVLQRIKRIAYNNNKNLNNMEKIFLGSSVVLSAVLVLTFSSLSAQQQPAKPIEPEKPKTEQPAQVSKPDEASKPAVAENKLDGIVQDDPKDFTGTITTYEEGKSYTLIVKNNVVKGLFIDSERIPDEKFADYKALTDKFIARHEEGLVKKIEREKAYKYDEKQQRKMEDQHKKDFKLKSEKDFEFQKGEEFKLKSDMDFKLKEDKDFKFKYDIKRKEADHEKKAERDQKEREKDADRNKKEGEKEKDKKGKRKDKHEDKEFTYEKKIESDKEEREEMEEIEEELKEKTKEMNEELKEKQKEINKETEKLNKKKKDLNKEQEKLQKEQDDLNKKREQNMRRRKSESFKQTINNGNKKEEHSVLILENGDSKLTAIAKEPQIDTRIKDTRKPENPVVTIDVSNPSAPKATPRGTIQRNERVKTTRDGKNEVKISDEDKEEKKGELNDENLQGRIFKDLRNIDLVKNKTFIAFELNDRELRVNGQKQNEMTYDRFKRKYLKGDTHRIFFTQNLKN